jgi:hypothetical protein
VQATVNGQIRQQLQLLLLQCVPGQQHKQHLLPLLPHMQKAVPLLLMLLLMMLKYLHSPCQQQWLQWPSCCSAWQQRWLPFRAGGG